MQARRLPLVMWHGAGQSAKTWETTPDGREGYQNIFLRRGFAVYLLDQPRRGKAGRSAVAGTVAAVEVRRKSHMRRLCSCESRWLCCSSRFRCRM